MTADVSLATSFFNYYGLEAPIGAFQNRSQSWDRFKEKAALFSFMDNLLSVYNFQGNAQNYACDRPPVFSKVGVLG